MEWLQMVKRVRIGRDPRNPRSSAAAATVRLSPFGPPPLLEGEDSAAYDDLLARVSAAVKPTDILEDCWVRDVVDLIWESFRLRRLKSNLMMVAAPEALQPLLEKLINDGADQLTEDWARRKPKAVSRVN